MAHHRVELVKGCYDVLYVRGSLADVLCQKLDIVFGVRNELVERRIKVTDRYGVALHSLVYAFEVALLHGLDLCKSLDSVFLVVRADHLAECLYPVRLKEHVFCST